MSNDFFEDGIPSKLENVDEWVKGQLFHAVRRGTDEDNARLKEALQLCPFLVNLTDTDKKFTLLHRAALYGRAEIARTLLEANAPLEARDTNGHTPLLRACLLSNQAEGAQMEETVRVLVNYGADVHVQDYSGTNLNNFQEKGFSPELARLALAYKNELVQAAVQQRNTERLAAIEAEAAVITRGIDKPLTTTPRLKLNAPTQKP